MDRFLGLNRRQRLQNGRIGIGRDEAGHKVLPLPVYMFQSSTEFDPKRRMVGVSVGGLGFAHPVTDARKASAEAVDSN